MMFRLSGKYSPSIPGALLLAFFVVAGCAPPRHSSGHEAGGSSPVAGLPRPEPAYIQWLERQTMLRAALRISSGISGTRMLWRNSAVALRPDLLLEAAPNWLEVSPYPVTAGPPLFSVLAGADARTFLAGMAFSGIYVASGGEKVDVWGEVPATETPDGENIVSLNFDSALGGDDDFEKMADNLEKAGIQMGGDLPSAATGMGPDFMLQARRSPRFDGIYAMVSVPREIWKDLPSASSEWDCRPLPQAGLDLFVNDGLLPARLTRDFLPWATRGGWAATGEVCGVDGRTRRWLYRYSGNVRRPVLLWQDPSGNARRIFSAAVIRHTGMQRQALAGVKVEPLMGLDARFDALDIRLTREEHWSVLTPGSEALFDIAHEAHRYGGWLVQADVLPQSLTKYVLDGAVDFARDTFTWPATVYALLSGDVTPLAVGLRDSVARGLEHKRLARGLHDARYVDWRPLLDMPDGLGFVARSRVLAGGSDNAAPDGDWRFLTTSASLAARIPSSRFEDPGQVLRRAHFSLLSWRMGLPGLVFVSPSDLVSESFSVAGGRDSSLHSLFSLRTTDFLNDVGILLATRRETGLSRGILRKIVTGPSGCIAAVSELPDKRHWLLVSNFSSGRQVFSIALPKGASGKIFRDVIDSAESPVRDSVQSVQEERLELTLEPYRTRHLLLF